MDQDNLRTKFSALNKIREFKQFKFWSPRFNVSRTKASNLGIRSVCAIFAILSTNLTRKRLQVNRDLLPADELFNGTDIDDLKRLRNLKSLF